MKNKTITSLFILAYVSFAGMVVLLALIIA